MGNDKTQNLIGQRFFEIGQCIYCGDTGSKLTKEHVVPYGLGGNTIVLKKACCEKCRVITSRCERNPIHDNWAEVRAALDFPSRRRKLAEETFQLEVTLEDGSIATLSIKGKESLGLVHFLEYEPPAFFAPHGYESGVTVIGAKLIGFGVNPEEFKKKHKIKGFRLTTTSTGNDFEKMIAKMAYCLTVACLGLDYLDERYVLPAILNEKDDVGYWMGCNIDGSIVPLIGKQPGGFAIRFHVVTSDSGKRNIIVGLKFFPPSEAPEYIVVVGSLKADFQLPLQP
jgi:hypothetical protein